MYNLLITFFCIGLETFLFVYMICCFLNVRFHQVISKLVFGIPFIFIACFLGLVIFKNDVITFCLGILFLFIVLKFLFQQTLIDTLLLFGLSYVIYILIELLVMPFMGLTPSIINDFIDTMIGSILTTIFIIIFCHFVPLHKFCAHIFSINKYLKLLICNGFICLLLIVLYSKISPQSFFNSFVLILFSVLILMLFNIHTLYYTTKLEKQQEQLSAYEKYLPIVNDLIDYVRMRQHGFDNQLLTLRSLPLNHRDYDSLSNALTENTDKILKDNNLISLLKINQKLISGFLFNKYLECTRSGKHLIITLNTFAFPNDIPEYELIDIIGILIDNAIEATSDNGTCFFSVDETENEKFKITTKNVGPIMTPELRKLFFRKGYTTKNDEKSAHGLGLYTLKQYIQNYNGSIRFSNEYIDNVSYLIVEVSF